MTMNLFTKQKKSHRCRKQAYGWGFPWWLRQLKKSTRDAGEPGSIPGWGRSPGEGKKNLWLPGGEGGKEEMGTDICSLLYTKYIIKIKNLYSKPTV